MDGKVRRLAVRGTMRDLSRTADGELHTDHSITEMHPDDGDQILAIYRDGIATGNATFETDAPSWDQWDQKHLKHSRLVARDGERILGWAALSPVSDRCAYAGVAEVSVYVSGAARGEGVGGRLLAALIEASEAAGIWTLQAGVFPENQASIAIHLRAGFREVGRRERLGQLKGKWRDVVMLERRSRTVGQ